ncbi:MAG: hypothetical protein CBD74_14780 [Saprospirales bacterium TMED214]|nr:MAG: hypothetical protein CBD74_14780 [Saprospirales bacterium TMED214]
MKLTESQARRAIKKWLFEFATDSGVSRRPSTDDKIAGKLGDDREDQPSSTIPQETPIMAMSQMSTQLTQDMPAVEDPDFIPATVEELGRAADVVSNQVPHSEIEWYYSKIQDLAEEAIEKGNKVNILDEYEPDEQLQKQIRPTQKASKESTNESWNRWSKLLMDGLSESRWNRPGKMTTRMKNKKLTASDLRPYRPNDDFDDDLDDDIEDSSSAVPTPPSNPDRPHAMGGTVVGGVYRPSQEDLEDMSGALDRDIDELPGFDRTRHRTRQEVITQSDGEEAKLRELVNLKIFPNITTMSGMRKMIKNQIDPIVQIWFNANALSKQMSQFITSSAGQYMFFDALTCSKLFTDDNVLELKGVLDIANALIHAKFVDGRKRPKKVPAKYKKQLAKSGEFLRSEVEAYSTTRVPASLSRPGSTGETLTDLMDRYERLKDSDRDNLMSSGLYSAVMANIVVAPILRRWAKEVKAGTIDISSSKNKGQVTWKEAGKWIDQEVLRTWNGMGNGRKGKKVEQAMQGQMEFYDAIEAAQEEAEYRALELEDEGHEVEIDDSVNVEDL